MHENCCSQTPADSSFFRQVPQPSAVHGCSRKPQKLQPQVTDHPSIHLAVLHSLSYKQKYHTAYGLLLGRNDSTCVFSQFLTRCGVSASFISATVSLLLSLFTACQQLSRWHSLLDTSGTHLSTILMNQTFSLQAETYKNPCVLEIISSTY